MLVENKCSVIGCENRRWHGDGLCPKHHYRFVRNGTAELIPKPTLRERFLSYICPEPFSGCWLWIGAADTNGYGVLTVDYKTVRVHRIAYELFIGPIGRLFCCHKCDTPLCANPAHLFLGTNKENLADMSSKGRGSGENSYHVLTNEQVIDIRAAYVPRICTYKMLGRRYGVDDTAIYKIVHRKTWAHI
jgi:hypothetical protein